MLSLRTNLGARPYRKDDAAHAAVGTHPGISDRDVWQGVDVPFSRSPRMWLYVAERTDLVHYVVTYVCRTVDVQ